MASDVAARDNYLTLALFSRRIIEALKDVQKGKRGATAERPARGHRVPRGCN
jgi:hypothetical protein